MFINRKINKYFIPILLWALILVGNSYSQHECTIELVKYSSGIAVDQVEPDNPERMEEIGKFEILSPSEGTTRKLTFPVKGTRMSVFVNILYDDNLAYYTDLFDAINVTMTVSEFSKPDMSKSLSVVTTRVQHTEWFRQVQLGTLVRKGNRWYDFWINCRLKDEEKQKDWDKYVEQEKKEKAEEKENSKVTQTRPPMTRRKVNR